MQTYHDGLNKYEDTEMGLGMLTEIPSQKGDKASSEGANHSGERKIERLVCILPTLTTGFTQAFTGPIESTPGIDPSRALRIRPATSRGHMPACLCGVPWRPLIKGWLASHPPTPPPLVKLAHEEGIG